VWRNRVFFVNQCKAYLPLVILLSTFLRVMFGFVIFLYMVGYKMMRLIALLAVTIIHLVIFSVVFVFTLCISKCTAHHDGRKVYSSCMQID
jgi:apolipoprotein N-acyltransferase